MPERSLARLRPDEARIRTFGLTISDTTLAPPQPAGFDAFVTVGAGVANFRQGSQHLSIDRTTGVFAVRSEPFALAFAGSCDLRIVYVCASLAVAKPGILRVGPLLRALIERSITAGYLDPAVTRDARVLDVLEDELFAVVSAPNAMALIIMPSKERLRAAAAHFIESDDRVSIASAAAGMTARTFDRAFRTETGLTPRAWRKLAILDRAHSALMSGASVTEAGLACGYTSTSAFIAAYRAAFGDTPGRMQKFLSQSTDSDIGGATPSRYRVRRAKTRSPRRTRDPLIPDRNAGLRRA